MKNKKRFWISIAVAGVLIVAVIAAAVVIILSQQKEDRYYEQMKSAKAYMDDMDYRAMVRAYEEAIELMPEDPDAYIALAEHYMEQGEYEDAEEIAEKGYENTGSTRLHRLLVKIGDEILVVETEGETAVVEGEDSPTITVRNNVVSEVSEFCYQQYVNEYGDADIKYLSKEEGCRVKFKGLNAYLYFKNTSENKNAVDNTSKKPTKNAKPYKVAIVNPQIMFVGFNGYISNEMVCKLFGMNYVPPVEQEGNKYYILFEYIGCEIKIPTDSQGNVYDAKAQIELYPTNLISSWVEPEEIEEDDNTFELAGNRYSYDITSLYIYGETLDDLSPLAECKSLRTIQFYACDIGDLSPLSGCDALEILDLGYSTGNLDLSCLANLTNLRILEFHECKDISDISCIMNLELEVLHPCGSSVSKEQCIEYQERHPNCEVWFDYYYPIPE
ncbi:MAG: tetratricopeptide repeat protein [Ruminococcus sp.]|nr:tetratricopeptide repeat protein [Ruminococcus sp.]